MYSYVCKEMKKNTVELNRSREYGGRLHYISLALIRKQSRRQVPR